jgi:hypothetical protein
MERKASNPYLGCQLDDWSWEFLRRNTRYIKAYESVQRLKARLDRESRHFISFALFRIEYRFVRTNRGNGWEWRYERPGKHPIHLNDLPSPDSSSRRYKGKLLKKIEAVTPIDATIDEDGFGWTPAALHDYEIAIQIDTRFSSHEIKSALQKILDMVQPKKKLHVKKFKDYLAVWDLRQQGKTLKEIAQLLWPEEYAIKGGPDYHTAEKGSLVQKVSDHENAAQSLIDGSFPRRKRRRP